jgi:phenylpropionate dioxygenase-like ring-hydroxylating dioxygenase large terminal subunit
MDRLDSHNTTTEPIDYTVLVQAEQGLVSRRIFIDSDIYQQELARVFGRSWLFLCHDSQLQQPGDFFCTYMGEDPVLVTRAKDGQIRAFLNSCRHRGMKVCRADEGNTEAFTCSYHAWTYASDGRLIGVPHYKEAYFEELDRAQWGLVPVAQLDAYRGLIFATWDATAPTLDEYLGDMKYYIDLQFGRRPGGTEVIPGTHKWQIPCNWKFAADNFVGDLYHAPYSHGSAVKVQGRTQASHRRRAVTMQVSPGGGHGMGVHRPDLDDSRGALPAIVEDYIRATRPEVAQHLSHDQAYRVAPVHSTIFPNFSFLNNGTIRVWHPKGPEKMEVWAWVVVEKDAPPEVKRAMLRNAQYNFSVSGIFEQDDGENWNQCSASNRGYIGRQQDFNYQMGLGHEERMEEFPGQRGFAFSEINQRGFYKRWREMMLLDTWDELRPGLRSSGDQ